MKLDTFVRDCSIEKIDLMKLDTESTEHLVIEGGYQAIKRSRPLVVCEVQPTSNQSKIHQLLDPLEYRYFWITDQGLIRKDLIVGDPRFLDSNYLFIPQERTAELHEHNLAR